MKRILLYTISILLFTSLILFYRFLPEGITGFYPKGNISIDIGQRVKGDITALLYERYLNFTQIQDITAEFTNIGSTTLTEKIEISIYYNNQSKLQDVAYYYDSQAVLTPGNRRTFTVSFLPPYFGVYYIKARVPYDTRAVEKWGSFLVSYTPPPPVVQIITTGPSAQPSYDIIQKTWSPDMVVDYPETVKIKRGESALFSILVKNTGNTALSNVRFGISTTNFIDVEINPKQVFKLARNDSAIFLISINTSKIMPLGDYSFDFEVITDEIKESKSIELKIVSELPVTFEEINETILNYEYIISEVQHEIDSAALKGIDITLPQDTLNKAKSGLDIAKEYYQLEKYEDARSKLVEVKKYLEDAVYQLAVAGITISKLPAFIPTYIILILIIIGALIAIILVLWKRRKDKEKDKEELKRPKILRNITETET